MANLATMTISLPFLSLNDHMFPDVESALSDPDGLLAAGGDLSPVRLVKAYSSGIFPWYSDPDPILWWSPDPRSILNPTEAHTAKSLLKFIRKSSLKVTWDHAFNEVIEACSEARAKETGTWITPEMKRAYSELHQQGFAHSVEVWDDTHLVGGLYGVNIGKAFFGESMFSRSPNTSKVAFHYLCRQLAKWQFPLLDCQVHSAHIASLGAKEVARSEFLTILKQAITLPAPKEWIFDWK